MSSRIGPRISEPRPATGAPPGSARGTTWLDPGEVPEVSGSPTRDRLSSSTASSVMAGYAPVGAEPSARTPAAPEQPLTNPALAKLPGDQRAKFEQIERRLTSDLNSTDPDLRDFARETKDDLDRLLTNGTLTQVNRHRETILDQIQSRLDRPLYQGDPPRPAPDGLREQVLAELIHGLARPVDISQGEGTTTCTTAVVQTLMARSDPGGYANFALGLIFDGKGETPTGKEVTLDLQEVANRNDGSILDPVIQGSLIEFGLAGAPGSNAAAGGGRQGMAATAGGGRGGTRATGGGGRGGTQATGGGGRGGTQATGGGGGGRRRAVGSENTWPVAQALTAQDERRFLDANQLKNLIKNVMGQDARAIELGGTGPDGKPTPATDRQLDSIRNALAGEADSPLVKKGKWAEEEDANWSTVFTRGVPAAIGLEDSEGQNYFHAVMIVGIDRDRVTFVDPQKKDGGLEGDPRLQTMDLTEFKRRAEWAVLPPSRPRGESTLPPAGFRRGAIP